MPPWLALLVMGLASLLLCAAAALALVGGLALTLARDRTLRVGRRSLWVTLIAALAGFVMVRAALRWGRSPPGLAALDVLILTRPRDASRATSPDPRWEILAGDLHCHTFPWDGPVHAVRDLDATVALARAERLDFVVVVPHLWQPHWTSPGVVPHYRALHHDLRAALAARSSRELVLVPGAEYTDDGGGHAGLAFGDMDLALSAFERRRDPSDFFRAYAASGGLLTIHHPFLTPLPTRMPQPGNISWRPFTAPGAPVDPVITTLDALATQVEAYNYDVSEVRDRFGLDDRDDTIRRVFAQIDREAPRRGHRLTPTGGTDSHGSHLRATMFVLAERRDAAAIRDAMAAGRTCVRSRAACTLEASADGGAYGPPGSVFEGVTELRLRAQGERVEVIRDGEVVARPRRGEAARVAVAPGRCTVLRARVGDGWSGPVYANCGW